MIHDPCPRCRDLVEELQEEVRQLKARLLTEEFVPPPEWRLTPSQTTIMRALCSRKIVSREHLIACMEANNPDWDADRKVIDVQICKMRQRLVPFGVKIITQWAIGYSLDDDQRPAVIAACSGFGPAQVSEAEAPRPRDFSLTALLLNLLEDGPTTAMDLAKKAADARPGMTLDTVSALLITMTQRQTITRATRPVLGYPRGLYHYQLPANTAVAA